MIIYLIFATIRIILNIFLFNLVTSTPHHTAKACFCIYNTCGKYLSILSCYLIIEFFVFSLYLVFKLVFQKEVKKIKNE